MNSAPLYAALLLLTTVGCDSNLLAPIEPNGLNPARIAHFGEGPTIEVPAAAVAGEPFAIVITTFGGGCIEKGPTNVATSELRIDIRPMDFFFRAGANCPDFLRYHIHRATVTGSQRGTLEVRVHGTALSMQGEAIERRTLIVTRHIRIDQAP
jgi:hypothetical protein